MPPNTTPTTSPAPSSVQTITDPVTKLSFSRDTSKPGSTFQPVAPSTPATPTTPTAPTTPTSSGTDLSTIQDKVAKSLGYDSYNDAVTSLTAAPTDSESQFYNDAYKAAGLDQVAATIAGKQNDQAQASANIDDNPWLDEADRVGRQRTLTSLASADIKNYQDEYKTKLASVENVVKQHMADQNATSASNKAKLAALEAQAKAAAADAASSAKTAATPPKTIKDPVTGTTYKWDSNSQSFVQLFAGKSGSAGTSLSAKDAISGMQSELQNLLAQPGYSSDGYINPKDWDTALNAWLNAGQSASSFVSNFKKYANPNDTYTGIKKSSSSSSSSGGRSL